MDGRAGASPGELGFKRGDDATAGLKCRAQVWSSCGVAAKGSNPAKPGLVEFHRDDVAILWNPRHLRQRNAMSERSPSSSSRANA